MTAKELVDAAGSLARNPYTLDVQARIGPLVAWCETRQAVLSHLSAFLQAYRMGSPPSQEQATRLHDALGHLMSETRAVLARHRQVIEDLKEMGWNP